MAAVSCLRNTITYLIISATSGLTTNTGKGAGSSLRTYLKITILIFSLMMTAAASASCWFMPPVYAAQTAEVTAETVTETTEEVATAGDAGYLTTPRTLTDIYNVLVLILLTFVIWVFWNLMRTLIRILVDFKHY